MPWQCQIVKNRRLATNIGDMWKAIASDGTEKWYVILPNGEPHDLYLKTNDGTGWNITGQAPDFTVSPSINWHEIKLEDGTVWKQGWHGWLQSGVLTDDVEGRTYKE